MPARKITQAALQDTLFPTTRGSFRERYLAALRIVLGALILFCMLILFCIMYVFSVVWLLGE